MKKFLEIRSSPADEEFRRVMRKMIASAKKEILVITGEAGAFKHYQDLKWEIKRATERGVKVRVYARSPEQSIINQMVEHGCEVFLGKDVSKDHYTIIDKKSWVKSLEHEPGKIGVREGEAHFGDAKNAKELAKKFEEFLSKSKKVKFDKDASPLLHILKKPLNLSFKTNSKKIELTN